MPVVGDRAAVVDYAGRRIAVIEVNEVPTSRRGDVDFDHVRDEGEGDDSVAAWRAGHEDFWHGIDYRGRLGNPEFTVNDDTPLRVDVGPRGSAPNCRSRRHALDCTGPRGVTSRHSALTCPCGC